MRDDDRDDFEQDDIQKRFIASDSPSEEITRAIAEAKGVDPAELDPLYDVVDPDALDELFSEPRAFDDDPVVATFPMAGCQVILQSDGTLSVLDSEEAE